MTKKIQSHSGARTSRQAKGEKTPPSSFILQKKNNKEEVSLFEFRVPAPSDALHLLARGVVVVVVVAMASSEVVLGKPPPHGGGGGGSGGDHVTTVSVDSGSSAASPATVAEAATLLGSVYLHRIGQEIAHHKWLLRQR